MIKGKRIEREKVRRKEEEIMIKKEQIMNSLEEVAVVSVVVAEERHRIG
jgi:hypothetical protein